MESLASPRRGSISRILASSWVPSGNSLRRSEPRGVPVWPAGMKPRAELDEGAEGLEAGDLALVARAGGVLLLDHVPRVGDHRLAAEPELALLVDAEHLDLDLLAGLEDLLQAGAAVVAGLGHVHQAL